MFLLSRTLIKTGEQLRARQVKHSDSYLPLQSIRYLRETIIGHFEKTQDKRVEPIANLHGLISIYSPLATETAIPNPTKITILNPTKTTILNPTKE
jgi:hypothetical protein